MQATVATIMKNRTEGVRIQLSEYSGLDLVDICVFADLNNDGERKATKKGVCLIVQKLPDLIFALQQAERKAREAGLLKDKAA